jgi:hypothetical protein
MFDLAVRSVWRACSDLSSLRALGGQAVGARGSQTHYAACNLASRAVQAAAERDYRRRAHFGNVHKARPHGAQVMDCYELKADLEMQFLHQPPDVNRVGRLADPLQRDRQSERAITCAVTDFGIAQWSAGHVVP